jgi:hypothetical protein
LYALSQDEKRSVITPEILSRLRNMGLEAAKRTLKVTTQAGVRNVLAPEQRKLRQRLNHLRFPDLFRGRFYTDTLFSSVKSIRGHVAVQVYTNGKGFDRIYPMKDKKVYKVLNILWFLSFMMLVFHRILLATEPMRYYLVLLMQHVDVITLNKSRQFLIVLGQILLKPTPESLMLASDEQPGDRVHQNVCGVTTARSGLLVPED